MTNRGRKNKWDELDMSNHLELIEGWARDGATDRDIIERLGISHDLFYKWKRERSEFNDALKRGKEIADVQVENAMFKSAIGYEFEEVKTHIEEVGDKKKKRVEKTVRHIPPNITAQIFWLKNRKPEVWRDKQNIEHNGDMTIRNPYKELTTEELRKLANLDKEN